MQAQKTVSDLVREYFSTYESGDRAALEAILSDDFSFHSPHDARLDRATYFRKCWPNRKNIHLFRIENIFEAGNEAFVRYECEPKIGARFRNSEFFRVDGGKITEVEVYYGSLPRRLPVAPNRPASSPSLTGFDWSNLQP